MKMNAKLLISLACVSLGLTACSDDYFDQEAYDAKMKQAFPVDDVDPTHTWATMGTAQINATVNGDYGETYRVAVYKENPHFTSPVTLLTAASVTSGSQASLTLSFPLASPFVYVACYDKYNHYLVKAVEVSDGATVDVNFFGEDTSAARQQNTTRAVTNPNLTDTDYSAYVKAKETKKDYMAFVNPTWVSYENIPSLSSITRIMSKELVSNNVDALNKDSDGHKWWCLYEGEIDQAFNLEGDQNKVNKAVVYVLGTLNLKKSYTGVTFIVGQGGKLNINTDIDLGQASRIVVLSGGTLTIAQGKKLQLGNNGVSVGLYNAGTVNVQGTLNGGGTTGALLYNAGTMTIKTLENMRYLFNYGTMTITDNFTIPNNADCPISTTNKYHFYNEGELTISTGTTGDAVNYGKITGTGLSISDTYLFNGGEITFSSTFSAKTLYNFGKLTAKKNTSKDASGNNIYNDRFIYNACYLHYTEGITQDIAVKNLFMMKNSRFVVDGDFYLQDADHVMHDKSMLEVAGAFGMPKNLNFKLKGPEGTGKFAIIKIGGKLIATKCTEMKFSGNIYFDWAKISDPYNNVEIQNKTVLSAILGFLFPWWWNDTDYLLNVQMGNNFITESTAPANITIPAGDCTGTGYNTTPPTIITPPEEVVQGYRFCFEDNFPTPGDYDFNDCVITVYPKVEGTKVELTVSLDGVGATKTIGAALRLVGINESDIRSASCDADLNSGQQSGSVYARVTPVRELDKNGKNVFAVTDKGYAANRSEITDLVVRLFDNAHYAMSGGKSYDSKFYNTVSPSDPLAGESYVDNTKPSRTMTFTFEVSDEDKAQQFLDQSIYDVFIVENHNGKTYEVHTLSYKFDEVLGAYYGDGSKLTAYMNTVTVNYPWAVCVPHSSTSPFYYPREWWSISGTKIQEGQDTENYGGTPAVYPDFKSWAADKTQSQEWYENPVMDRVFKLD